VTIRRNGQSIAAVAQVTKAGLIFVLDRRTGRPLFPVHDVPVPASDVPGEKAAATQPMPTAPAPFARQRLTADLLTIRTPAAHAAVLKQFPQVSSRGPFDPPSLNGTILLPGMDGGAEWGGAAWDPETGLLYVNANEMAWTLRLKPRPPQVAGDRGSSIYVNNCSACHGANRQGAGSEFPNLQAVGDRLAFEDVTGIVTSGQGRMPSFGSTLTKGQIAAVANFVLTGRDQDRVEESPAAARQANARRPDDAYVFDGYKRFLDPDGYPALKPPWGTLSAIDLSTGRYVWRQPLGEYPELAARGLRNTGSENYGGAVVTKGGLLFIAATVFDNKFRAFDKRSGKLLWQTTLPDAGLATPATYYAGGRQFVAIAAGGGKNLKAKPGGKVVAFALPLK
jgi:quinoprotein glucose dehydrogenase